MLRARRQRSERRRALRKVRTLRTIRAAARGWGVRYAALLRRRNSANNSAIAANATPTPPLPCMGVIAQPGRPPIGVSAMSGAAGVGVGVPPAPPDPPPLPPPPALPA